MVHTQPKSVDTLISEHSADGVHTEDDHQVTQMQTIAARNNSLYNAVNKVGALFPRNATQRKRARQSTLPLSDVNADVVIGVSIERATVDADSDLDTSSYATVYAEGPTLRHRSSWMSLPGSMGSGNLFAKAKVFTQKFKRRGSSRPELSNSEKVS